MTDYDKESFLNTIMNLIDNFVSVGSGWKVHHVMSLSISFASYRPMQGSSYIYIPNELLRKQAVLNIFKMSTIITAYFYAILANIHPVGRNSHPKLAQNYSKFMAELKYEGLEFPLKITDVPKLEKMNPDISINVLFYENRNPFPVYNSPHRNRKHHVNLLLIMDEKNGTSHYLLIRSLSRLVGDRISIRRMCALTACYVLVRKIFEITHTRM